LLVQRFRVACPKCGPKLEHLAWLERYARVPKRSAESVARLCRVLPVKHVADFCGLGWDAVKAIDKAYLEVTLGEADLSDLTVLAMDEFAIQRGHRYVTIFVEPNRKEILGVYRGHGREDIRPFFEKLGGPGRGRLEAVAMDMNGAHEAEAKAQCSQAKIIYDRFHMVAKCGREAIDAVHTAESKRQTNRGEREVLKGLWNYRLPNWAHQFFRERYARAIRSRIKPLQRFASALRERIDGIRSHGHYPLHTSLLEGIMNKIKVIKRMTYGFRDDDSFFLKIRAAFPGNPG